MAEVERRQCTARSKRTGNRCQRPPRVGATVCHQHGGASRRVQRVAARRLAEAKAAKSLAEYGVDPIVDPAAELLAIAEEARAVSRWLADYVAQAQDQNSVDAAELRARVDALGQSQQRAARILTDLQKLGLDERRVRIREAEAAALITVLERVLRQLGHDVTAPAVRAVVHREIEAVTAGGE